MFYIEQILPRWATQAVSYPSRDQAEKMARETSKSGDNEGVRVYDCTQSPRGTLVATYYDGRAS